MAGTFTVMYWVSVARRYRVARHILRIEDT
jgi:hypothetical protein